MIDNVIAIDASRQAIRRADQHLKIQSGLNLLEKDIFRISRTRKSKLDSLSSLENRIISLRKTINENLMKSLEEDIQESLTNKSEEENSRYGTCPRCGRKILSKLLKSHNDSCIQVSPQITHHSDFLSTLDKYSKFPPKPPRESRLKSVGCDWIEWLWQEPISDGGFHVLQYEICYTEEQTTVDEIKKIQHKIRKDKSILTSNWCLKTPISHNGYKIINLKCQTGYLDFRIRCWNEKGWSDWLRMTKKDEIIYTASPNPPTIPLHFNVENMTSSCIYLRWISPQSSGGCPIKDYHISYTVVEKKKTATKSVTVDREYKIREFPLSNYQNSCVIRNLPSDSIIKYISIVAQNDANLFSNPAPILKELKTASCSRHELCRRQLAKIQNTNNKYFDTDFITGVYQRVQREDFIQKLHLELSITTPTDEEISEAQAWEAIMTRNQNKMELQKEKDDSLEVKSTKHILTSQESGFSVSSSSSDVPKFSNHQRRQHFKIKIESLEDTLRLLQAEKVAIDNEKISLSDTMKELQARRLRLRLELTQMKDINQTSITSSILRGHNIKYRLIDYLQEIEAEISVCNNKLRKSKLIIIKAEKRKDEIAFEIKKAQTALQERKEAFSVFEKQLSNELSVARRLLGQLGNSLDEVKSKTFHTWVNFTESNKRIKKLLHVLFWKVSCRLKRQALFIWSSCINNLAQNMISDGVGSDLLNQAKNERQKLKNEFQNAMGIAVDIQNKLKLASMSKENLKLTTSSPYFHMQEESLDLSRTIHQSDGLSFLMEADLCIKSDMFERARTLYDAQIIALMSQSQPNLKYLGMCYGRLGRMFMIQERFDCAIVEFDRQLSLAKEAKDDVEAADAYFGLGFGYLKKYNLLEAIRYLDISRSKLEVFQNTDKLEAVYKAIQECYERLGKDEIVNSYKEKIDGLKYVNARKFQAMEKLLTEYSERLMSSSACSELIVSLERITFRALELRKSIVQHGKDLKETKKQIDEQNRLCQSVERVLDDVAAEMKEAIETDELEIWSKLVHDQPQLIDVEELKVRLKNRQELELKKLEFEVRELKKLKTTMDNLDHETKELNDYFSLEQGELIRKQTNRPFRCVAYTMVNILGDDVTGAATGGVEVFAAAESFNVHIFSYFTGEVLHIFSGGNHTNGNSVGHTGVITCLAINSMHVFSGSVDESIIAWNHNDMMRERTYLGHEGSIVALSLDDKTLASSSADLTIRLWNILDCQQLRVIYGHVKSVLALHLGSTLLLSGSADGEIRIWNINQIDRKCVTVECSKKLLGHEDSVTCVTCGDLEAVSGDSSGVIVVWWLETGQMLRKIQVHKGSIRSLQFDAVHIVSGGMDSNVCITDLAGGNVVQTLRGHESVVLAVAFDSIRIISTSVDNSLRFWRWGNKGSSEDKTHILGNDETLLQVSKKYDITLEQLVTWNGIFDPRRQVYPGLALIVKKGDTDSLTKAEKAKLDRDRRLNNTQSTNQAKLKGKLESNFSHVPSKYSELDDKAPTLGNRIYAKYKKDNGLFPIAFDSFAMKDDRSLAARIKLNGKFSKNNRKEDTFLDSKNPFILSVANVDIWGPISDELASTMLEVFVEKEIVQLIRKVKYDIHPLGSFSIGGRMSHLRALQLSKLSTQSTIPLDKIDEDDGINVKE